MLTLTDTLNDDRLCGTCGETAEVFGLDFKLDYLAERVSLAYRLCFLKGDLRAGVLNDLNYLFLLKNSYVFLCGIYADSDICVASICSVQSLGRI